MKWTLQDKKIRKFSFKKLFRSFKYAFAGIGKAYSSEQNLWVHTIIMVIVLICSFFLEVSPMELCIIILVIGIVFALEFINTAIEYTVDIAMPNIHPLAKIAKDISSGAVLVFCLFAVIIGLIIFIPKIISLF